MIYKKSLKPYLLNAFYTWTIDLGLTPHMIVKKDMENDVPEELKNEETIIFNIHPRCTRNMVFGKEHIEFHAKFNGVSQQITVLHTSIIKIFNSENNYGLDFEPEESPIEKKSKKPKLKIVKKEED